MTNRTRMMREVAPTMNVYVGMWKSAVNGMMIRSIKGHEPPWY